MTLSLDRPKVPLSPVQDSHRRAIQSKLTNGEYSFEAVAACQCGASEAVALASADRYGFPIGVVGCVACGLVRSSPRLATRDLPAFYADDYHGLHIGVEIPGPELAMVRAGQGNAIYAYCQRRVAQSRMAGRVRVMEVGAGSGRVLREFGEAARHDGVAVELIGCEYSDAYAGAARQLGVEVRTGGIEVLADAPSPNVLILSHIVEHFPNPNVELPAIRALIDPMTLVYVEVPGLLTIHTKPQYGYAFDRYLTLAHTYHFTLATLTDAMARAGFERVDGDQEVRGLFRAMTSGPWQRPADSADRLPALLAYLAWLRRSPQLRTKRALRSTLVATRRLAGRVGRRVLGERRFDALRGRSAG